VALQLARGALEPGWIQVVYSDFSAGVLQAATLGLGLLPSGPRRSPGGRVSGVAASPR